MLSQMATMTFLFSKILSSSSSLLQLPATLILMPIRLLWPAAFNTFSYQNRSLQKNLPYWNLNTIKLPITLLNQQILLRVTLSDLMMISSWPSRGPMQKTQSSTLNKSKAKLIQYQMKPFNFRLTGGHLKSTTMPGKEARTQVTTSSDQ